MSNVTIKNNSCVSLITCMQEAIKSFGATSCTKIDNKSFHFAHSEYTGTYSFTGSLFAKLN